MNGNQNKLQWGGLTMENIGGTRFFRHLGLILIIIIGILLSGSSVFAQVLRMNSNGILLGITDTNNIGTVPGSIDSLKTLLEEKKDELLTDYKVAGFACAIITDSGDVIKINAGKRKNIDPVTPDVEYPVTNDTIFQAGSISKPVSAWGLMKMKDLGWGIVLNAPITTYLSLSLPYLSDWTLPTVNGLIASDVTLSQILIHNDGIRQNLIPNFYVGYFGWTVNDSYTDNNISSSREQIQQTGKYLPTLTEELNGTKYASVIWKNPPSKLYAKPGVNTFFNQAMSYSGSGYAVMQKVMENVLKNKYSYSNLFEYQRFNKFMKDYVLNDIMVNPNQAISSSYLYSDLTPVNLAKGYDNTGNILPVDTFYPVKTASGLYTTAPDLANFVKVLINDPINGWVPQIINPAVIHYNGNYCILYKIIGEETKVGFVGKYIIDICGKVVFQNPDGKNINLLSDPTNYSLIKDLIINGYTMKASCENFWGHSGFNAGFKSLIMFNKQDKAGLVVLTNSDNGDKVMNDIASAWLATNINIKYKKNTNDTPWVWNLSNYNL